MKRVPQIGWLADGRRLHLQDGPIDLIVEVHGSETNRRAAYDAAARRFTGLLDELCDELPLLRRAADPARCELQGAVARRMDAAVAPFALDHFITPMAAVAGAVAEEILGAMLDAARLERSYVNNGGDIALHLAQGNALTLGVVNNADNPAIDATARLDASMPVRGVATSGWRGRSQSLGIADAVTIFAADAAAADAAATMVANAVDVEHPAISRIPARALRADSDLGELPVTVAVGALPASARAEALANGCEQARELQRQGLIYATYLALQGEVRTVLPAGALAGQAVRRTAGG